eukprot:CAMPEP_0178383692 /NCGR_PEP_ID=MMETSP0689_2-20121128/7130_1 /TAXON_ID=160604 /ORGANISM="Amphidinium massartii, Strain CS-259" /LENGTH=181 /DNA_ID=CAMNT_0020003915 /DNA_START=31 /DNA_END=577 /DNA_ORIENTATION=-
MTPAEQTGPHGVPHAGGSSQMFFNAMSPGGMPGMPPPVPWMPPPGVVQPGLQNLRPDGQGNGYLVAHTTRVAAVMMPVMAVVGMSSEAGLGEDRAAAAIGLTKEDIAWWLADDRHLADVDELAAQDPPWSCSICSEGVEEKLSMAGLYGYVAVTKLMAQVALPQAVTKLPPLLLKQDPRGR